MQNKTLFIFFYLACLTHSAITHAADLKPSKIFIAGDSTAAEYSAEDQQGWGAELQQYFRGDRVEIDNRAVPARSSRTYITEGYWAKLINDVSPGDFVLIQFGHNDASAINDKRRARGTLKGIGTESKHIKNQLTGQDETVFSFGHYIRKMVQDVRDKNAVPVLLSLTVRNIWINDKIERGSGNYGACMYQLALELDTATIDVTNLVADELETLGQKKVNEWYPKDHTHFNKEAANLYARTIVSALKGMKPKIADEYYSDTGATVEPFSWTFVRLPVIQDSSKKSVFLVGDSTVRNGTGKGEGGEWGWGAFLLDYMKNENINIVNRAVGGFSSRTFVTGDLWQKALNMMRPGDYVLLQFGHNDSSAINDSKRARGTIKGVSDESITITNLLTGEHETVYSYGWYLRTMIGDAMAKGVTPIICSPVPRKTWDESTSKIVRNENSYANWAKSVASTSGVDFIDLYENIAKKYDKLGPEKVDTFFADARTHTNLEGAHFNAKVVASHLNKLVKK